MKTCKLFYDKYAGDHSYHNSITSKVSIEDLSDGSYTVYYGDDAFEYYNNISNEFQLPVEILSSEFCSLEVYTKAINKSMDAMYATVSVDLTILDRMLSDKKGIPEADKKFLQTLLYYHNKYDMNTKNIVNEYYYGNKRDIISKNRKYIIDKCNQCVDYISDMMVEQHKDIKLNLYKFQKCNIYWMLQRELNKNTIYYNIREEIQIGDIYYDIFAKKFNKKKERKSLTFHGGALIDEVGKGKTIQMIGLALENPAINTNYIRDNDKYHLYSRATLVICPTHLCKQWKREIENNIKKDASLVIIQLFTKRDHDKYTYQDYLDADFVITTFTFLANKVYTTPWVSKVSTIKSFHTNTWSLNDNRKINDIFRQSGKELVDDPLGSLYKKNIMMHNIHWHRLVVDEFHEAFSNRKYYHMVNLLPYYQANYRWVVTATPFICNLLHTINFITNFTNEDNDMILTNEDVVDYIVDNCFRRNTEESTKRVEGFSLPPVEEKLMWLKFTSTERMMYNAHLADPNNNKFGKYLRQLCCHPQLAEETKYALSNCKTLADVEKMMVLHYQNEEEKAKETVDIIKKRIVKIKKKLVAIVSKKRITIAKKTEILKDIDIDVDDPRFSLDINSEDEELEDICEILGIEGMEREGINDDMAPSITFDNFVESLRKARLKLNEAEKVLDGKSTTYNFFKNVIDRLRRTVNKESKPDVVEIPQDCDNILDYYADLSDSDSDDDDDDDLEICGICLSEISEESTGVTKCGHIFCYECLKMALTRKNTCPYCKQKLREKDIFLISCEWKKKKVETKEDIEKNELIDKVGTKLANLIFFLRDTDKHSIIFSQWDDLLRRVGKILSDYGIKNVFCKGNCYQRDKAIRDFNFTPTTEKEKKNEVKVIMLSSEKSAAGTNLTKAQQVIFLDPIYGDYTYRMDQERQAIGRAHRMGQKNTVEVIRFIIRDTVEEEIYNMNLLQSGEE